MVAGSSQKPPQVRARYMQSFVNGLDRVPEQERHAIRSSLRPGTLEAIAVAPMLGWLPLAVNVECTKVLAERLGRERADSFFRDLILEVTNSPLLHGVVLEALRVTIRDPGMYLPWIGKGWNLLFRDCGRFSAKRRGDAGAILELRGVPPEALGERVWIDRIAVSLSALTELLGFQATVVASQIDASSGTVVFVASWRVRERAGARAIARDVNRR
jgi:hypothetical protein